MALLGNTSFFGRVFDLLEPLKSLIFPSLAQPEPLRIAKSGQISWGSCKDVDFGWNQSDLLFPIQCANISVPLDYTTSSPETAYLQLLRVHALHEPSKGSVIINPGGPGESGVDYLALRSSRFHAILDGQYDLVSFDPRGTGNTTPFSCASNIPAVPQSDNPKVYQRPLADVLAEKWEMYEQAATECFQTELEHGQYMSTAFTARDMLQVVNALNEDGMLRYWGSSYGTVLGMTFASMFPNKVDRMMLDAVVNPHEYMAGTSLQMLDDADNAYAAFLEECLGAPEHCSLSQLGSSTSELSDGMNDMLEGLLGSPQKGSTLYREIKNDVLYRGLYWPSSWHELSKQLLDFINGDFSSLEPQSSESPSALEYNRGSAAVFGTRCADSALRVEDAEHLTDLLQQQQEGSRFADVNLATSMVCAAWQIPAAERYMGNFSATTAHPILFVNGRYDPAAPLVSALNGSAGFPGSKVLVHDGFGHGLGAHPNLCVARAIRAYFSRGEMPADLNCAREGSPFELDMRAWQNNPHLLEIT